MRQIPQERRQELKKLFDEFHAPRIERIPRASFEDQDRSIMEPLLRDSFDYHLYQIWAHGYSLGIGRSHISPNESLERRNFGKEQGRRVLDKPNRDWMKSIDAAAAYAKMCEVLGQKTPEIPKLFGEPGRHIVAIDHKDTGEVEHIRNRRIHFEEEISKATRPDDGQAYAEHARAKFIPRAKELLFEAFVEAYQRGMRNNPKLKGE